MFISSENGILDYNERIWTARLFSFTMRHIHTYIIHMINEIHSKVSRIPNYHFLSRDEKRWYSDGISGMGRPARQMVLCSTTQLVGLRTRVSPIFHLLWSTSGDFEKHTTRAHRRRSHIIRFWKRITQRRRVYTSCLYSKCHT